MLTNTLTALNKGITRALRSVNSNLVRGDKCSYSTVTSFVDNDIKKIQNRKPRRVLFNVPGSDERKITKGTKAATRYAKLNIYLQCYSICSNRRVFDANILNTFFLIF